MTQSRKNPYQFSLSPTTGQPLNVPITLNIPTGPYAPVPPATVTANTIGGFDGNVTVFVKNHGAQVSKNGLGTFASSVVIQPGDTINVKVTTSNAYSVPSTNYTNPIDVWVCAGQSNMTGFPLNNVNAPACKVNLVLGFDTAAFRIGGSGATFTGVITGGNLLTASSVSGTIGIGATIYNSSGFLATVASNGTGTGGAGTYNLSAGAINTSSSAMFALGSTSTLSNPIGAQYGFGSTGSSLPEFGNNIVTLSGGRPICFMQTAIGATNLTTTSLLAGQGGCWDPSYTNALFTGAITSGVLTVSGFSGSPLLVGYGVYTASGLVGTIQSFGSGTGGNGTYNLTGGVNTASTAMCINPPIISSYVPGGELFTYSVNFVNAGMAYLITQGYKPFLRGILWAQGEDDSAPPGAGTALYQSVLSDRSSPPSLISAYRTSFSNSALPFFIYRLGAFTGVPGTNVPTLIYNGLTVGPLLPYDNYFQGIRQAQENVGTEAYNYIIWRNAVNFLPPPSALNLIPQQVGPTGSRQVGSFGAFLDLMRDNTGLVAQATFTGTMSGTVGGNGTLSASAISGTISVGAAIYSTAGFLAFVTSGSGSIYVLNNCAVSSASGMMVSGPYLGQLHYSQDGYNDMGFEGATAITTLGYAASNWTPASQVVNLTIGTTTAGWMVNPLMDPQLTVTILGYISGTTLQVNGVGSVGNLAIGASIVYNSTIVATIVSGSGGNGTYTITPSQTLGAANAPVTMTAGSLIAKTAQPLSTYVMQTCINRSDASVNYLALSWSIAGAVSSDGGTTWHSGSSDPCTVGSGGTLTVRNMTSGSHGVQTFVAIGAQISAANFLATTA